MHTVDPVRDLVETWRAELGAAEVGPSLTLDGHDAAALEAALLAAGELRLEAGRVAGLDGGALVVACAPATLAAAVAALELAQRAGDDERGAHALWLDLGAWRPVRLERRGEAVALVLIDDEPRAVDGARAGGAPCLRGVTLAAQTLGDELVVRADELVAAPLVRALALGEVAPAGAEVAAGPAPLDVDPDQRGVLEAARHGASLVVDGPPGTGKTQTIVNLVAQTIAAGQTCLVVSSTPAALRDVTRGLAALGLGEAALAWPTEVGSRAATLAALVRAIDRGWRPSATAPAADDGLAEAITALDAHHAALHAATALGRTIYDALARLGELRDAPRVALPAAAAVAGLTPSTWTARRAAVERYARAAERVGDAGAHPWRTSRLASWQLGSADAVAAALDELGGAARALAVAHAELAGRVPGLLGATVAQLDSLATLAAIAARSPRPGAELIDHVARCPDDELARHHAAAAPAKIARNAAIEPPRDPLAYLAMARRRVAARRALATRWTDELDTLDVAGLAARVRGWEDRAAAGRWLALRGMRATLRRAYRAGELPDDAAVARDLELAAEARALGRALAHAQEPARRWFGALAPAIQGGDDDAAVDGVAAAVAWAGELRSAYADLPLAGDFEAGWRALIGEVGERASVGATDDGPEVFAAYVDAHQRWGVAAARLATAAGVDALGLADARGHLPALEAAVAAWRDVVPALRDWVGFVGARAAALEAGVGDVVAACERGRVPLEGATLAWERSTLLAWVDGEIAAAPALAGFWGPDLHALVGALDERERAAQAAARTHALIKLAERVPVRPRAGEAPAPLADEIATLVREARGGGATPLRAVLAALPGLTPRLRPCLIASPAAVARLSGAGWPAFDRVIFDEASRLALGEAAPALARAAQAIVVGDPRQLPPPGLAPRRSVLDAALAAGWPVCRLGIHYRSQHPSLIAFVRRHAYDDALAVWPAPAHAAPGLGLRWLRAAGIASADGTHAGVADAVVAEVVAQLAEPQRRARSLAVVVGTEAQGALVTARLAEVARARPELAVLLGADLPEPLLVRTAERMQGEVRDVVLLALGLGVDAGGALPREVGALGRVGGERVLWVAASRARRELVVIAACEPEALVGEAVAHGAAGRGVRQYAELLLQARDGGHALVAADLAPTDGVLADVAAALAAHGHATRTRVGDGLASIGLAVIDADLPECDVLAIDTDGPALAGAGGARERDRLRDVALGALGWRTHRIWAIDWLADREREVARLLAAIQAAQAAARTSRRAIGVGVNHAAAVAARPAPAKVAAKPAAAKAARVGAGTPRVVPPVSDATERQPAPPHAVARPTAAAAPVLARGSAPAAAGATPLPTVAKYLAASTPTGRRTADDLFLAKHADEAGRLIEQVLAVEAPIHVALLSRRVGAYFGIGKVTPRVVEQVRALARGRGLVGDDPDVVWRADQAPADLPAVRVAGDAIETRRTVEEVPLAELASAALVVLQRGGGAPLPEVARDAARLLGIARVTERVVERAGEGVALLVSRGLAARDGKRVVKA